MLGLLFLAIIVEQSVTSLKKEKNSEEKKKKLKRKEGEKSMLLEVGGFGTCTEMYISDNEGEL